MLTAETMQQKSFISSFIDDSVSPVFTYCSEDNSKLKSLSLFIERLTEDCQNKEKCLEKELLETLISQVICGIVL